MEQRLEFLTDAKSRSPDAVVEVSEAGVSAQALSYIEMSIREVISLKLDNGQSISVVCPEAWVFHKGLTFPNRTVESKKYTDLYGIWFVLTQLNTTSVGVRSAIQKLFRTNHPSWRSTFMKNLTSWCANASPRDWSLLSSQDVQGRLSKETFLYALREIGCAPKQ